MKSDVVTAIIAAVAGVAISFVTVNLFLPDFEDVSFKTVNANMTYNLTTPDDEVFNYRAVNPTVEVYVGECEEYNELGECVELTDETLDDETLDDENGDTVTGDNNGISD